MAEQTQSKTGTFVWNELMSKDFPKARSFYTTLFGWSTREMDMGPAGKYTIWVADGQDVGGGMGTGPGMSAVPSHWLAYVQVANADAIVAEASKLGGKVIVPATDIPGVGRFAVLEDPTGAAFGILAR